MDNDIPNHNLTHSTSYCTIQLLGQESTT